MQEQSKHNTTSSTDLNLLIFTFNCLPCEVLTIEKIVYEQEVLFLCLQNSVCQLICLSTKILINNSRYIGPLFENKKMDHVRSNLTNYYEPFYNL